MYFCVYSVYTVIAGSMIIPCVYCIAGKFRGIQFSRMSHLQRFRDLIFEDGGSRTAPPTLPVGTTSHSARATQLQPSEKQKADSSYNRY